MAPLGDRLGAGRRVRVRAEFEERVLVGPQRGSPAFAPTDHEADDVAIERERSSRSPTVSATRPIPAGAGIEPPVIDRACGGRA